MKRLLISIFIICNVLNNILAIPAYPGKIKVKQGDNTWLTIIKKGDEKSHLTLTTDGYPLVYNTATSSYEYAILTDNTLVASGLLAHDIDNRQVSEVDNINKIDAEKFLASKSSSSKVRRAPARKIKISDVHTLGLQKALVVLVDFPDKKFSMDNPSAYYNNMLNQPGFTNNHGASGSARDFYQASSNGMYDPDFVVVGPVTVSKSYSYYGGSDGTSFVANMISEAVKLIDDSVDFSEFDTDHDGRVDNVYVFYAGYGQADSGYSKTIWPHSWELSSSGMAFKLDGVFVDRYACSQEINGQDHQPAGIGTFVHEFGHVLGLADHYNTVNSKYYSLDDWDTMSAGSYNNNQNTPPLFSAFERAELGWLTYTQLNADHRDAISIKPLSEENKAYKIDVPGNSNEYFILENRQQQGWDKYLPGHGMLVWHVDMDSAAWYSNTVNNTPNHLRLKIVEADGVGSYSSMSGDAFPGTDSITKFLFNDWNDNYIFGIDNVSEVEGCIGFSMLGSSIKLSSPSPAIVDHIMGTSARVIWNASDNSSYYQMILKKGDDIIQQHTFANDTIYHLTGLQPQTNYTALIYSSVGKFHSDTATVNFITLPLQFCEQRISLLPATFNSDTDLTVHWKRNDEATKYLVTLYDHQLTGKGVTICDFTDRDAHIPAGWTTNCDSYIINVYGRNPHSLKMDKTGSYISISNSGALFTGLKFWMQSSYSSNVLKVLTCKDGQWTEQKRISIEKGKPLTVQMKIDKADSIRIESEITHYHIAIDDIEAAYLCDELHPIEGKSNVETSQTEYRFDGLLHDAIYSYTVTGARDNEKTLVSDTVTVTLNKTSLAVIKNPKNEAISTKAVYFDMQGRQVNAESLKPNGLYIVRRNGEILKFIKK